MYLIEVYSFDFCERSVVKSKPDFEKFFIKDGVYKVCFYKILKNKTVLEENYIIGNLYYDEDNNVICEIKDGFFANIEEGATVIDRQDIVGGYFRPSRVRN